MLSLFFFFLFIGEVQSATKAKEAPKNLPKFNLNVKNTKAIERRPLANVNKAKMNDEERQDKRKQLFKQGKQTVPKIKGVRTNRRFELMMKNRKMEQN